MASSLEGTRLNVLSILQRQGSITVDQLAQVTGLASATIRRHLDILQRDNLVAFRQVRKKLGRPEYSYFLTEDGQESGYRDYRKLLTLLMSEIKRLDTDALANKGAKSCWLFSSLAHPIRLVVPTWTRGRMPRRPGPPDWNGI